MNNKNKHPFILKLPLKYLLFLSAVLGLSGIIYILIREYFGSVFFTGIFQSTGSFSEKST